MFIGQRGERKICNANFGSIKIKVSLSVYISLASLRRRSKYRLMMYIFKKQDYLDYINKRKV